MDVGDEDVTSSPTLRVLGFTFSDTPTVNAHAELLVKRLRTRTWALSKLRRAGFNKKELVKFYCGAIRPVAEYASPAFHSLLPGYLSDKLERQQSQALKNIYGTDISAGEMRRRADIQTLQERRESATLKFAEKALKNPRFKGWFPQRHRLANTRTNRPFLKKVSRTDRNRNSPINYMIRALNDHRQKTPVTNPL